MQLASGQRAVCVCEKALDNKWGRMILCTNRATRARRPRARVMKWTGRSTHLQRLLCLGASPWSVRTMSRACQLCGDCRDSPFVPIGLDHWKFRELTNVLAQGEAAGACCEPPVQVVRGAWATRTTTESRETILFSFGVIADIQYADRCAANQECVKQPGVCAPSRSKGAGQADLLGLVLA
jgi:hypothetical protein